MESGNRVAIVTGGAGELGMGIARKLGQDGFDVVIVDINPERGDSIVNEIRHSGRNALFLSANIRRSSDVNGMTERVLREFRRIDILVNCAGGSAREKATLFHESSEEVWDDVIEFNLKGTRNCCRAIIPAMIEQRYGKIVNIASTAGGGGAYAKLADYSAAKAGIIALTRVIALEVAGYGINANCVSPGPVDTQPMRAYGATPEGERVKSAIGFGRFAKIEEVAHLVAFLASDQASFITGQDYAICGLANIPQ
jgi:NAD(P)-dependent dehydrogenase (short-subunit alcohol dehydrogenase family)